MPFFLKERLKLDEKNIRYNIFWIASLNGYKKKIVMDDMCILMWNLCAENDRMVISIQHLSNVPFSLSFVAILLGSAQFSSISMVALAGKEYYTFRFFFWIKKQSPLSNNNKNIDDNENAFFWLETIHVYDIGAVCRLQSDLIVFLVLVCCNDDRKSSACRRGLYFHLFCFAVPFFFKSIRSDAKKCKSSSLWMNQVLKTHSNRE